MQIGLLTASHCLEPGADVTLCAPAIAILCTVRLERSWWRRSELQESIPVLKICS